MTTLTVQLSEEPTVALPTELARQAGLSQGDPVEVIVTAEGLTIAPVRDYAEAWRVLESHLRYQTATLGLSGSDKRDESYWQIVDPMLEDLERDIPV